MLLLAVPPAVPGSETKPLRIGLTPVFLDNQTSFLRQFERYLERRLHRPVVFVQRQSYREILDLLLQERLAFAWICGYPYVLHQDRLRLLAVPLYGGKPLYQSYLIVPAGDTRTHSIEDLQGKVFAYSDPDSNSGFLVPQVELLKSGIEPKRFFAKTFYTWSHRGVVVAVADGLAQGGSVDGYVWDTLNKLHPALTRNTRVVWKSAKYGFPPLVANSSLPEETFTSMQEVLLNMSTDSSGKRLLQRLNIDGFIEGDDRLYDGIRSLAERYMHGS